MILNFGSVNIDNCYQVRDFVRAGETISALEVTRHAGGKGFNQSVALARAGAKVCHAGCIGEDGLFLRDMLRAAGVDTDFLRVTDTPTGNAIIQVNSRGENCIILYTGANGSVTKDFADEVLKRFGPEDLLLIQNEISSLPYIIDKAKEKGMRIAFNPSPMNSGVTREMLGAADWLFVNQVEASEITGAEGRENCLRALCEMFPRTAIIMTLGGDGVVYRDEKQSLSHGIYPVNTLDTTGAGDTFTGFFLGALASGGSVEYALELASKAAAISVTRSGAAESIPTLDEVLQFEC